MWVADTGPKLLHPSFKLTKTVVSLIDASALPLTKYIFRILRHHLSWPSWTEDIYKKTIQIIHNKADVALPLWTHTHTEVTEPLHPPWTQEYRTSSSHSVQCKVRYCVFLPLALHWNPSLVARKIPFDDPLVLNYVRLGYVVSQLVMLGVYCYVSMGVRLHLLSCFYFTFWPISRSNERMTRLFSNMAGWLFLKEKI